uniref:Uncharacterized protein n=1 Tax=Rubinisphaera brasiliensis (strain ATCC 49424 / DSM 5305 / JCM 21570 / IAM 15109 / NBRC 103401 / IFAM 1448) TaxID=756272 RepID=F0SNH3_RUBBR|nr:hypothetical protein Plabr_0177 [Rubinisphaera brasiliensis DSM 5305]
MQVRLKLFRAVVTGLSAWACFFVSSGSLVGDGESRFRPAQTIVIGSVNRTPDGALGATMVTIGVVEPTGETLSLRARAYPQFVVDEKKRQTFSFHFSFPIEQLSGQSALKSTTADIPDKAPLFAASYLHLAKGDTIILPHGLTYEVTSFVEKLATEAGPDAKYFGIVLTLKSPGNEELSYPFPSCTSQPINTPRTTDADCYLTKRRNPSHLTCRARLFCQQCRMAASGTARRDCIQSFTKMP